MAKIDAIQVRNFNFRTQEEITVDGLHACDATELQTGVIAQELESVLPNAVTAIKQDKSKLTQTQSFGLWLKQYKNYQQRILRWKQELQALEG